MPFNVEKFQAAEFKPRIEAVEVPGLCDFFDGEPVWMVRGLTASEVARSREAYKTQRVRDSVAKTLEIRGGGIVTELREKMGLTDATPADVAVAMETLVLGSVDPVINLTDAVRLSEYKPTEFAELVARISKLTGMGFEYAKQEAASQKKKTSQQS